MNPEIEILRALNDAPTHLFPDEVLYSHVMHAGEEGLTRGQFDSSLQTLEAKKEIVRTYGDRKKSQISDHGKARLANY